MSPSPDHVILVGPTADEAYPLPQVGYVLIGRDQACDIVVHDPSVSRRHAVVRRRVGEDTLEDVGSRGGTWVNGVRLVRPQLLADGDRVRLAGHHLIYRRPAAPAAGGPGGHGADVHFDVRHQQGGTINNVGRDQHLSYVAHVQQQRDSFARDIAATKTRARWFAWTGLAITVVGFVVYAQVILRFLAAIFAAVASRGEPDFATLDRGPGGVAGIAIGFFAVVIGVVVLTVGVVMHVVAAARRRKVDRELPLPLPPWAAQPERSRG
jgi:hypothetical protein